MRKFLFAAIAFLFVLSCVNSASAATKLRIAGNFPVDHSSSEAMEIFKAKLAEYSNGEISVDLFPAMQLGGASENVDQVRSGSIFATWISVAYLSRTVPELEALSLPFAFSSREQAFNIVDGEVGALLNKKLAAKGIMSLGYMELGLRHLSNSKRRVEKLEDFKGLKIRLQPNEVHLNTFRALGASPISMDISEVYQALQQGVLDGQENPYSMIQLRNFNEVQKYLTNTAHFFDFIIIAVNKRAFDKMKPADQEAITKAISEAIAWQREKAGKEDDASLAALIKSGMEYNEVSSAFLKEMRAQTAPIVEQLKKKIGTDLIDVVLRETGE